MHEALIIGGGPAGAGVAIRLAAAGRQVLLVERQEGPHDKVCGEFLSAEADRRLRKLGVDVRALGAVSIDTVKIYRGTSVVSSPIPFKALSLSRRVVDEALVQRAIRVGAEVRRGVYVRGLRHRAGSWEAQVADASTIQGRQVFLATGKHNLHGRRRPHGRQNDLIGFKQHWRLMENQTADLEACVELHLFEGGYAGLEPIEGGRANLCLVVTKTAFARAGGRWSTLLEELRSTCPALRQRLEGGAPCTERPLAISEIPYGYVRSRAEEVWSLGDQAAVIPSFAGEGVSMALESAYLAADCMLLGQSANQFQHAFADLVRKKISLATTLSQILTTRCGQVLTMTSLSLAPQLLGRVATITRVS